MMMIFAGPAVVRSAMAVIDYGVAEALGDTVETPAVLAARTGVSADMLGRMLRLLASFGIFRKVGDAYGHTPLSRLLRSDHPMSIRGVSGSFTPP